MLNSKTLLDHIQTLEPLCLVVGYDIYIYIDTHIHTTILASIGQDSERWEITYSILWALTCFNVKERWNKGNTGISMWVSTCSKQFVMKFICKNPYEIIVIHRKSLWIW